MIKAGYGELAYSEFLDSEDHSVPNPFYAILANPDIQLTYLIELYPYSATLAQSDDKIEPYGMVAYGEFGMSYVGGINPVYLSNDGFVTEPTDNPVSEYFIAQVDNPLSFETSILSGDEFMGGNQSFGAIQIKNGDGELDYIEDFYWSDRRVVVKTGAKDFAYNDFSIIFDGLANDIEANDEEITLTIRDNRSRTDQYVRAGIYAGTGGLEGNANLANTQKPLAFGTLLNIEPVLVDAFNLIYQFHDGEAFAVDACRDAGIALVSDGDVLDIIAALPPAGHFVTNLANGLIKLGATPAGRITADVRGDNTGDFANTVTDIVYRIATTRLGINSLSSGDIEFGSFNKLKEVVPGAAGVYITEGIAASAIFDQLIYSVGGYWNFSRQGLMFVGVVAAPGVETDYLNEDNINEEGISLETNISPAWRISVGYAPAWTLQGEEELAGATTAANKTFAAESFRYVTYEDSSVRAKNKNAKERVLNTYLTNKADAEDLLARMVEIYSVRRKVYSLKAHKMLFRLFLGETVKLTYDRFDLVAGKNLLIVGVGEDAESGQTTFKLWG